MVSSLGEIKVRALETDGAFQSVAKLLRLLHHKHFDPIFLLSQEAIAGGSEVNLATILFQFFKSKLFYINHSLFS